MATEPFVFELVEGVDTYSPDLTAKTLKLTRLKNIQPRRLRWNAANGFTEFQALGTETIEFIANYRDMNFNRDRIYAITDTSIYPYDFGTSQFSAAIYTSLQAHESPRAIVPWIDRVYLVSPGIDFIHKIKDSTVTKLSTTISLAMGGKYAQVSHYHLMIANVYDGFRKHLRVQWSNLFDPEDFTIASDSEADFFDLEPGNVEITGLSYQRGRDLVYTKNSIWISDYQPLPVGYRFEPFITGLGNVLHGGQIRVREIDFFIGDDNFYLIDGFQLRAFGDGIWSFFREEVDFSDQINLGEENFIVRAFHKQDFNEIWWLYRRTDASYWIVVYNYRENKWSDRDPQGIRSHFQQLYGLRSGSTQQSHEFFGADSMILEPSLTAFQKLDETPIDIEAETAEFDFDELFETKEIDAVTVYYSGAGSPALNLQIGTRDHRMQSVSWSAAQPISNMLADETTFFIRGEGVGRLIRFKFTCSNTNSNYISELVKMSFHKLIDDQNAPED